MKQKKAQLLTQPLFLIFAMIIGALILFFGYNAIVSLSSTAGATVLKDWTNELSLSVEEATYLDVGSSSTLNIELPEKIKYFCIQNNEATTYPAFFSAEDKALASGNKNKNVLFIPSDAYEIATFANIPNLEGTEPIICFPNGARFRIATISGGIVQAQPLS